MAQMSPEELEWIKRATKPVWWFHWGRGFGVNEGGRWWVVVCWGKHIRDIHNKTKKEPLAAVGFDIGWGRRRAYWWKA